MSRFNKSALLNHREEMHCGADGFKMTPELELYSMVCTSLLTPQYYTPNTNDQINRIKARLREVDPIFAAQLAIYARENMYLRTIGMVLTAELAKIHNGDDLLRRLTRRVVQRADEITELVAYYKKANSKNIPPKLKEVRGGHRVEKTLYKVSNQIKKGLADIFTSGKFDEYQFAKYNRATDVKLRDVLFLAHPKPQNDDQKELFSKIANDTLETPYTWETQLSAAGQEGKDKGKVWEEMILSGKMGYMALLRNLRNFIKTDVSEVVMQKVADRIGDEREVLKSKQLPFRFLSAYRILDGEPRRGLWGEDDTTNRPIDSPHVPMLLHALEKAVLVSVKNMPVFHHERVLIATDVSGSMQSSISDRSVIQQFDIGALLAMLAQGVCDSATVGMFGDKWKVLDDLPTRNVLSATQEIHKREGEVGYSTNGYKVIEWAVKKAKDNYRKFGYDRVMIFTDCQMYGRDINKTWKEYKKIVPQAKLYLFNLSPYGQTPIDLKQDDVYMISGWSDKIFDVIKNIENGEDALDEIRKVDI